MSEDPDKGRRYLVPVARLDLTGQPDVVHLAVYEWLSMFGEWVTGPALCGYSTQEGPLPGGTVVTCRACLEWKPRYERMLAPGYRPEDDDPEALRRRAETAEAAIARVRDLHYRQDGAYCAICTEDFGRLNAGWPCDTIRALDDPAPAHDAGGDR